ncbi:MAG TPA: acyltransferase [Candidatus Limnocylindrales bacterium]|nr:acyltransferase [Candidatus Limnocylindrales bacterium]
MDTREISLIQQTTIENLEQPNTRRFYRPELDSLRFFAFFGVFVFHVVPNDPQFYQAHPILPHFAVPLVCAVASAGAFGVDLFFALSAYLITTLLIREEEIRGSIDTGAFYVRRILRIWPLYFFFIGVAAVVPVWDRTQHLGWPFIAGYLLLSGNWVYVFLGLPHSIASPLWSVSIEEQFYLVWPLALRRLSRRQLVFAVIGLLVLANMVRVFLVFSHVVGAAVEYNTLARIDAIAFGVLLAYFLGSEAPSLSLLSRAALAIACLGLWCMVASQTNLNAQTEVAPVMGTLLGRPLIALAAAGLLFAVIGAPAAGARALTASWLTYLGRISYGLYVYHAAGLLLAWHLIRGNSVKIYAAYALTGFGLTVLFSALSYRWLESPFLKMKERFAIVRSRPV